MVPAARGGVRFDGATGSLAVDDAHDNGPGTGAREFRQCWDAETAAHPEGDGYLEAVIRVGHVTFRRAVEHVEMRERVRVEPGPVPRIEAVGDHVRGLAEDKVRQGGRPPSQPRSSGDFLATGTRDNASEPVGTRRKRVADLRRSANMLVMNQLALP